MTMGQIFSEINFLSKFFFLLLILETFDLNLKNTEIIKTTVIQEFEQFQSANQEIVKCFPFYETFHGLKKSHASLNPPI